MIVDSRGDVALLEQLQVSAADTLVKPGCTAHGWALVSRELQHPSAAFVDRYKQHLNEPKSAVSLSLSPFPHYHSRTRRAVQICHSTSLNESPSGPATWAKAAHVFSAAAESGYIGTETNRSRGQTYQQSGIHTKEGQRRSPTEPRSSLSTGFPLDNAGDTTSKIRSVLLTRETARAASHMLCDLESR